LKIQRILWNGQETTSIIFRYDNTPHHPDVDTYPDHKHVGESVISAARPGIEKVLSEVKEHIK